MRDNLHYVPASDLPGQHLLVHKGLESAPTVNQHRMLIWNVWEMGSLPVLQVQTNRS